MRRPIAAAAAVLLTILLTVIPRAGAHQADVTCPRIISHRTSMLAAPENTVPGILSVPATGADGVEMDVQWSSSSFPVLMHDSTVDRTTNGTGAPASMGLGQLRALSAADYAPWKTNPAYGGFNADGSAKTPVPYGYEFMSASSSADLDALLDIHAVPAELGTQKMRIYVDDYFGWAGRTIVMGPADQVTAMHGWEPDLRYAVIEYNAAATIRRGESILATGATAYAVPARDITPAAVAYWHAYGLEVLAWTTDSTTIDVAATWRQMRDAGVDTLITNQPAAARTALCAVSPTTVPTTTLPTTTTPPVTPTTKPTATPPTTEASADPTLGG